MASKKTVNKSAFVRSAGVNKTAAEVVELGKKKGIKLSENYVYTIRSAAKRKAGASKASRSKSGKAAPAAGDMSARAVLVNLVLDIGVNGVQAILDDLRTSAKAA